MKGDESMDGKTIRSKRPNGYDGGFVRRKRQEEEKLSSVTLNYYLDGFRITAADILKQYGKLNEEQYSNVLELGNKEGVMILKKLKIADDEPRVCAYALRMLQQIDRVDVTCGLTSSRTEFLDLAQLVSTSYFLALGVYEDPICKGIGVSNGTAKANKNATEQAEEAKKVAQRLADNAWSVHPRLNKSQVASKIASDLKCKVGKEYKVSYIKKLIRRKKKN
jgi:hypothetical protein